MGYGGRVGVRGKSGGIAGGVKHIYIYIYIYMCIYIYIYTSVNPCISMHVARESRVRGDRAQRYIDL